MYDCARCGARVTDDCGEKCQCGEDGQQHIPPGPAWEREKTRKAAAAAKKKEDDERFYFG